MEELKVELGPRSYRIHIGRGTMEGLGAAARAAGFTKKMAIVSNPTVFGMYGERVRSSLEGAGFEVSVATVPDGEEHKTLSRVEEVIGTLLENRLDRSSAVVALGGGVVGDIAGFAASVFMRGIRFIQVPTTLLAQVDSSVGGKTGVNHVLGKNMIGTFWQPSLVWVDIETLKTLPGREVRAGLAEVIKYGVIWDRDFFRYLLDNRQGIAELDPGVLAHVVKRSCQIKAEVVSRDEREAGLRAVLNHGHTVGHALETVTGYGRYLHGEAVAIGMQVEALLSVKMGLLSPQDAESIEGILAAFDLPSALPEGIDSEMLLDAMHLDKKARSGQIRFVLPEEIGSVRIDVPADPDVLREFFLEDL
jgi:3-dehydroquinate synthase